MYTRFKVQEHFFWETPKSGLVLEEELDTPTNTFSQLIWFYFNLLNKISWYLRKNYVTKENQSTFKEHILGKIKPKSCKSRNP